MKIQVSSRQGDRGHRALQNTPQAKAILMSTDLTKSTKLPLWVCSILSLLAIAYLSLASISFATTVMEMDIEKISNEAELIFEGEVILRETQQGNGNAINTYVTFRVDDVIKGDSPSTLELRFLGGVHNGRITEVSGLRMPELGERGIYFVESVSRSLVNPLIGWSQGHYLIEEDSQGSRRVTSNNNRPITAIFPTANIPATIRKPPSTLGGTNDTAFGIMTESSAQTYERSISVDEFKQQIQNLIE